MKNKQNNNNLIELLAVWLKETRSDRNRWNRNPIGRLIRAELDSEDHWKVARRGNPKKGLAKQKESLMKNCEYL